MQTFFQMNYKNGPRSTLFKVLSGLRSRSLILLALVFVTAKSFALDNVIYWRAGDGSMATWWLSEGAYVTDGTHSTVDPYWIEMVGTGESGGGITGLWRDPTTGENFMGLYSPTLVPIQPLADSNWEIAGTGYFDGRTDTRTDILWRNKATGDNAVWFMDGTRIVSTALIQEVPDLNWSVVAVGDFNNDGYTDIVWHHATTGVNAVWYMQGINLMSTGVFQSATDLNWEIVGSDYFGGNASRDLLWRNKYTGDNAIWFMNGVTIASTYMLPYASTFWNVGGTGLYTIDTDGDGLRDAWERNWFGNLDQNGSGNPDNDSYLNWQEQYYGKNPNINDDFLFNNLGEAVDNLSLTWSCSGNNYWYFDRAGAMTGVTDGVGGDLAYNGQIYDNQSASIQRTVTGPGTMLFRWKVSSEGDGDPLIFYVDGVEQMRIGGLVDWRNQKVSIASGNHVVKWTYSKDYCCSGGSDRAYLDYVEFYPQGGGGATLAEALDSPWIGWTTTGSPLWVPQTGVYSPYGGSNGAEGAPGGYLNATVNNSGITSGSGMLSFFWKARCSSYGGAFLTIDGGSTYGVDLFRLDGFSDWTFQQIKVSPGGEHNISFYVTSGSGGQDLAWVDRAQFHRDWDNWGGGGGSNPDGLSDDWEVYYFGNTNSQSGNGDLDADGLTDLQEYLNGTNPTLPELRVKIASPRKSSLLP